MNYSLRQLAPGSYDVVLDGRIIGGLVRSDSSDRVTWTAELLEPLPAEQRPPLFTALKHHFPSLEAAAAWLGLRR